MTEMGRYCKAYTAADLARLPGWVPRLDQLAPRIVKTEDGAEREEPRHELADDDVLYLQDNYSVTDGIFIDEYIVFPDAGEQWHRACHEILDFDIPDYCREDIIVDASDQYTAEELEAMARREAEADREMVS